MSDPVTREDVLRKIDLAGDNLNDSYNRDYDDDARLRELLAAIAQSNLAVAYATLMVAENQPLGVLGDISEHLRELNNRHRLQTGIE